MGGAFDVADVCAGEPGDYDTLRALGDEPDRLEVTGRGRRKSRLDDVDTERNQRVRDLQLFVDRHRRAGRLLTIAQCRVEDQNPAPSGAFRDGHTCAPMSG